MLIVLGMGRVTNGEDLLEVKCRKIAWSRCCVIVEDWAAIQCIHPTVDVLSHQDARCSEWMLAMASIQVMCRSKVAVSKLLIVMDLCLLVPDRNLSVRWEDPLICQTVGVSSFK